MSIPDPEREVHFEEEDLDVELDDDFPDDGDEELVEEVDPPREL